MTYAVNAETGDVVGHITSNTWYDASGRAIKEMPGGSARFAKTRYDGLGRPVKTFVGYDVDESSYADATTTAGDTILEQSETEYDAAGNVIATTARQRMHDAVGTGELQDATAEPRARVTYTAAWYDAAGRQIASADYGTNGGEAFIRPDALPERSDTCLVTSTLYNARGEASCTIDPMGRQDRVAFDDAGRTIETIENYQGGLSQFSRSENGTVPFPADVNKTTRMTYTPDGQLATLTAVNPTTGDQTTRYVYGSTLVESFVARSDLLRAEIYPDSDDSRYDDGEDQTYDRIEYSYNAQGERKSLKDQNGTVRGFLYDKLGRLLHDFVESLGPGVDGRVRRISRSYGLAGRLEKLTSYTHAYAKTGEVCNEVAFQYDAVGLPIAEYQSHEGPVNFLSTAMVGYAHDETTQSGEFVKGLRPTRLVYPNGRVVRYEYAEQPSSSGASDDADDLVGRIRFITDDDQGAVGPRLVEYTRLGLGSIVRAAYPGAGVCYDLAAAEGADPYAGLDRFGRVVDACWRRSGGGADVVRTTARYDRAGNRQAREDLVGRSFGAECDEAYRYDGLYRLTAYARGAAAWPGGELAGVAVRQEWDRDAAGNWRRFRESHHGIPGWRVDEAREHNTANEILSINGGDAPTALAHDRNGNATRVPAENAADGPMELRYDAWDRLVRVRARDAVFEYGYDGQGRRIQKRSSGAVRRETRDYYFSAGWKCIQEAVTEPGGEVFQYVRGVRYTDELVCVDQEGPSLDGARARRRLYAVQDPGWSLVALLSEDGEPVERYHYTPYGRVSVLGPRYEQSSKRRPAACVCTFTGVPLDPNTGLYDFRTRPYAWNLGRFLTRDPSGYADGMSLYDAYFAPDGVDPFGLRVAARPAPPRPAAPPPRPRPRGYTGPKAGTGESGGARCASPYVPGPLYPDWVDREDEEVRKVLLQTHANNLAAAGVAASNASLDAAVEFARKAGVPESEIAVSLQKAKADSIGAPGTPNPVDAAARQLIKAASTRLQARAVLNKLARKIKLLEKWERLTNCKICCPDEEKATSEDHHVIPRALFRIPGYVNTVIQMNALANLCCLPATRHRTASGAPEGGSWYNDFVKYLLDTFCLQDARLDLGCVLEVQAALKLSLFCCEGPGWCANSPSRKKSTS